MRLLTASSAVLALLAAGAAAGASITLEAERQGWYRDTGYTDGPGNPNYLAGECDEMCSYTDFAEYRNFFIFDLSAVPGRTTAARLLLWVPENGFVSPTGSEIYELFHVETPLDELGQRWGEGIFADLGAGTRYGAYTATEADEHGFIEITLGAAALAELNAAAGLFALGGAITTLDGEMNDELLFGSSGVLDVRLVLETVPVPGAAWLFASALLAVAARRRSRAPAGYSETRNPSHAARGAPAPAKIGRASSRPGSTSVGSSPSSPKFAYSSSKTLSTRA
jgi:hypothetical protein